MHVSKHSITIHTHTHAHQEVGSEGAKRRGFIIALIDPLPLFDRPHPLLCRHPGRQTGEGKHGELVTNQLRSLLCACLKQLVKDRLNCLHAPLDLLAVFREKDRARARERERERREIEGERARSRVSACECSVCARAC
jgi:hypothetical protein